MRILVVTNMYPTLERPGYGAFVRHQAEQLVRFGHAVEIVNILGFKSKLNYLKGAVEVYRKTRGAKYNVVHAHYGLSAVPAWCRLNAPLVITLHGSDVLGSGWQSLCSRVMARVADAVIVVSEEMRRRIPGVVIPCGVDLNLFRPYDREEARARVGWRSGRKVILFPFDPRRRVKRYDLAKAAVERLVKGGIGVELVTVCGVENDAMPWYYSAADVMILCSEREGSPTSVKEALACGLPVVATDVGDVREMLTGVPGTWLCAPDVDEIARNLGAALKVQMNDGRERRAAAERYDQTVAVQKVIDVYKRVVEGFTAKGAWLGMPRERPNTRGGCRTESRADLVGRE